MAKKREAAARGDTRAQKLADAVRGSGTHAKRSSLYTGELAKPLEVPLFLYLTGWRPAPGDLLPRDTPEHLVQTRRVLLLFERLGVKPGDWYALAMTLAAVHVPGLQLVAPTIRTRVRGRPPKPAPSAKAALGQFVFTDSRSPAIVPRSIMRGR